MAALDETVARLAEELDATERALAEPDVAKDPARLRDLSRRHRQLRELVGTWRELQAARADVVAADELLAHASADERSALEADRDRSEDSIRGLEERLEELLVPDDPNAGRAVLVEIRGAEGGEEANLFARDLYDMYLRYLAAKGLKVEVLEERASERDGLDQVIFKVSGEGAWTLLEHEGGVHRVQRVPVTEAKGRIHTSSATVSVLPEAEEVDVVIDPATSRSTSTARADRGARASTPRTPRSASRTCRRGCASRCRTRRASCRTAPRRWSCFAAGCCAARRKRKAAKQGDLRRSQVGGGGRGEKIRTYNFKENRVTDHRINLTLYKLDAVMAGQLDEFVDALVADKRTRLLGERGGA